MSHPKLLVIFIFRREIDLLKNERGRVDLMANELEEELQRL